MRLLLRTPAPHPTESLLGHVLRVSEENDYDSPWHVLSLAGIAQSEMRTAGFPVRKLAAVVGRDPSDYANIAYQEVDKTSGFKLLGHALGESLVSQPLRLHRPAFCPVCVRESGYLDAFWDLSLAVACPKHGRSVVSACPRCGDKLSWFRPGLLQCKCGSDLHDVAPVPVEPDLQELMRVMRANLHRQPKVDSTSNSLPTQSLLTLPFRTLLALVRQLGRFTLAATNGQLVASHAELARAAANTLSQWPSGFHQLLRSVDARQDVRIESTTLRKRFESFYGAMFKGREDLAFLEEEFIRFGTMEWGNGIVDRRMLGPLPVERRYMSRKELSQRTGLDPRTLSKWARSGKLTIKEISTGTQKRYVADASELAPPLVADGRMLQARRAARLVGLPVSALSALKASGHFSPQHSPAMKRGYHEADLLAFKTRLLAVAPSIGIDSKAVEVREHVTLGYVMQEIRFWTSDGKGRFVAAYLDGEVKSIGRSGEGADGVLFKRIDIEEFAKRCRADVSGDAVSLQEVAEIISCPLGAVSGLIRQRFLDAVQGANRTRVQRDSVTAFQKRFCSLLDIAKELGTTTPRLERICTSSGIQTLKIVMSGDCVALFVDRTLTDAVRATWTEQRAKRRRPAIQVLNEYLASLRQSGASLPRKGSKPNRSAIAASCGFDRSVLASDRRAGILLNRFAEDEVMASIAGAGHTDHQRWQ